MTRHNWQVKDQSTFKGFFIKTGLINHNTGNNNLPYVIIYGKLGTINLKLKLWVYFNHFLQFLIHRLFAIFNHILRFSSIFYHILPCFFTIFYDFLTRFYQIFYQILPDFLPDFLIYFTIFLPYFFQKCIMISVSIVEYVSWYWCYSIVDGVLVHLCDHVCFFKHILPYFVPYVTIFYHISYHISYHIVDF